MYTLIAENKYGQQLELTHNKAYCITDIDGINPPEAVINTTRNAGEDGSVFNSSYMNNRTIIITMVINAPAEQNRIILYRYFKSKFPVRLYYKNSERDVYIDGYTQNIQVDYFKKKQMAQITIFCPTPHFNEKTSEIQELSSVQSLFEFPFAIARAGVEFSQIKPNEEKSIMNNGDIETGAQITIRAIDTLIDPKIINIDTGESMTLDIVLIKGDEVKIDTRKGKKGIWLTRGGDTTNIIGKLAKGSSWFVLAPGDNVFTVDAYSMPENMVVSFAVISQFEGV